MRAATSLICQTFRDPRKIKQPVSKKISPRLAVTGKDYFVYVCDVFCMPEYIYTHTTALSGFRCTRLADDLPPEVCGNCYSDLFMDWM